MRTLALVFGFTLLSAGIAFAQGVAINGSGAAADTSAILDVASSSKGFLPPRMTATQRALIFSPATGLLVWQVDATPGLYANTGTPGSPNWQLVGANAVGGQWSVSGANLYYTAGKVGIGSAPSGVYGLEVLQTLNGLRAQTNSAGGQVASFGGVGTFDIDAPGVIGGRLRVAENGNVGLGVTNPTNKLSFPAVLGKKISLYPGASGDVGFGVSGNRLQIYADNPNADVALGWDAAGTFNERFAVKPNGALAVVGNTGTAGQVLTSNGSGAAASWGSGTNAAYNNTYQAECHTQNTFTSAMGEALIPGLTQTFTTASAAKVLVSYKVMSIQTSCVLCGASSVSIWMTLDGANQDAGAAVIGTNWQSICGTRLLSVGAGTHTIDLRGWVVGNNVLLGDVGAQGSYLVLQVMPQ